MDVSESPGFKEETSLVENNVEFYIDEAGVKHYILTAKDSPTLGG